MALDTYWDKEPFSSVRDPVHQCGLIIGQTNWLLNPSYWFLHSYCANGPITKWSQWVQITPLVSHVNQAESGTDLVIGDRYSLCISLTYYYRYMCRSTIKGCSVLFTWSFAEKMPVASCFLLALREHLLLTQSGQREAELYLYYKNNTASLCLNCLHSFDLQAMLESQCFRLLFKEVQGIRFLARIWGAAEDFAGCPLPG